MSVFSNPAGSSKSSTDAYIKALLGLLGDRDPVQVLAAQVTAVQQEVAGLRDESLRRPEKPGKWSILQALQHLADSELVTSFRMRMILAHDSPELQGYDQDAWATGLKYNEVDPADAIDQLRVLRGINLKLIRSLDKKQWERAGMHSETGV